MVAIAVILSSCSALFHSRLIPICPPGSVSTALRALQEAAAGLHWTCRNKSACEGDDNERIREVNVW